MTLATRLTATAAPGLAADNSAWILFITDLSDTSTDGTEVGVWWATPGATDADKQLICYAPVNADPSLFAASWVGKGIMALNGDTLTGVLVDVAYSDSVVTVADLVGTEVDDGPTAFTESYDDGLIDYTVKSLEETMIESGFAKRFDQLADVAATGDDAPTDGQAPIWDDARGRWVPGTVSGGGVVDAVLYDLTGETPGAVTLDLTGHPATKAGATVLMPDGDDQTLVITPPDAATHGIIGLFVLVTGSVSVSIPDWDVPVASVVEGGFGVVLASLMPATSEDDTKDYVLVPSGLNAVGDGTGPVDAEVYDLTGESPGDLDLDMTAHPVGKAAAVVLMPAGSDQTLRIDTPAGALYGHIDVTVVVTGSVTVNTVEDGSLTIASVAIIGGGPQWVFAALVGLSDLAAMVLVPYGFNVDGAGGGGVAANSPITGATKTKITYDSKGLVTAGADATAADVGAIPDSWVDTDTSLAANSDTKVATQKAVKAYASGLFAANDALLYKGAIDCSANPNYPAADAGHAYKVSVAGKIGGGSGPNVEVGDLLVCTVDSSASGNHATVGANWDIIQVNLDGAVIGPASATDNRLVVADGTSGRLVKMPSTSVSVGQKLTSVTDPASAQDAATKNYVDTFGAVVGPGSATDNRVVVADGTTGKLVKMPSTDVSVGQKLTNVTDPTSAQHAATKNYVDTTSVALASVAMQRKTSDQTINNTTTLADITDLIGPTQAISTAWKYEWTIFHGGVATTTAGIDFAVTVPTGATVIADSFGPRTGTTPFLTQTNNAAVASGTRLPHGNGGSGSPVLMSKITAIVITDGSHSGTVALQFSQTTATGSNTTVFTNSVLDAKRIS